MPSRSNSTFRFPVRVYYEDTDAAGVVYYANYLKFIERARSEWLRSLSIELEDVARRDGVVFSVKSVEATYEKPARLGDWLDVVTEVIDVKRVSIVIVQRIDRSDDHLFSCRVRLACVDSETFRPKPIPPAIHHQIHPWKTQSN